ncbi:MAG TPA: cyclopropane-fatty-acyl-phospholipid synthase family protein [Candidatus Methylacidiphilales bacterium]
MLIKPLPKRWKMGRKKGSTEEESPRRLTCLILDHLVQGHPFENIHVRLWDGSFWPDARARAAVLVLNRPGALREMLLSGTEIGLGEAYLDAAFEVEGDMEAAFELAERIVERTHGWTKKLEVGYLLRQLPERAPSGERRNRPARFKGDRHSLRRDREAIHFHYDVSNDFYALWLDKRMAYSCAYFRGPEDDLETAQQNKFDHICRKLGLRPGERLLDIGCGWGGLILHAARHYGVEAEGITLSRQQWEFAQKRIASEGLSARVSVRMEDYREVSEEGFYDAIASVGMVEHVGREQLPAYFGKALRLLKPGGLFLNHGIGLGPVPFPDTGRSFIEDYVFPDADLVPLGSLLGSAEGAGWEIRDVESLREHYAQTLRHWIRRLETRREEALRLVDEVTYRVWRLYMAGCAHNFQVGRISVYQTLLAKLSGNGTSRAPASRAGWYAAA